MRAIITIYLLCAFLAPAYAINGGKPSLLDQIPKDLRPKIQEYSQSLREQNRQIEEQQRQIQQKLNNAKSLQELENIIKENNLITSLFVSIDLSKFSDEITDDTLKMLAELVPNISNLSLRGAYNNLTDKGRDYLARLTGLAELDLSNANIKDNQLNYIARLENLEKLILENTDITGVGLRKLSNLNKLKELYLQTTEVPVEAIREFKKDKPKIKIFKGWIEY